MKFLLLISEHIFQKLNHLTSPLTNNNHKKAVPGTCVLFSYNFYKNQRTMLITKLLLQLVPKSSLFCIETLSLVHKSRLFSSLQTNNSIVLYRLIESNVKTLNFVKLFSEDVQPVNGKGKGKRRRVISSDEEDDAVVVKKRFVTGYISTFHGKIDIVIRSADN